MGNEVENRRVGYDVSVIRPMMREGDVVLRGEGMEALRLRGIRRGLRALHTLELMAVTIYRFQITAERSELNRQLIAAMCNEMVHYQDFQVKLLEYGFRPSVWRWAYWLVGFVFGYGSRLLGRERILRTAIWVEEKAVRHYAELLDLVGWDDATRVVVEKDQADEGGHVSRWRGLLAAGQG